ncbi:gas vesicle protein GvpJ [Micromonospora sp. DSM 115977]|uniref:Gas vesicle protein A n=1 Tax=Micromonospora reichwaldensis TaxID=3075516 RepID=A0ABU2WUK9_9ACTN|nr:gas vesicle protein GvpJ [Micromonospora sp. DSM 115977]MDT0529619.1 gas vesicle protein GvpJ [Micromonospora sp. DSM 115977]
MTIATSEGQGGGALQRGGGGSGLADVVETVLDKGVVIDAQVSIAVVGIQLVEINARIVIASVETYLRFAEAVDRFDITPKGQKGLPDLVEGASGAVGAGKAVSGIGKTVGAIKDAVGELGSDEQDRDRDRDRDRPRRRRDEER